MSKFYERKNDIVFHDYYSRLKLIALSIFKWENLPDSCNARFLEDTLFTYGRAVFVNDPFRGFLNLKVTPAGELNVYGEPLAYTAFSIGYNEIYDKDDCVIIRNNPLEKSTDSTVMLFSERLTEIERSLETNIRAQKTPILIRCDEKTRTSLETIYKQYDGNKPVIFGSKSLSEKPLEVLNTGAPFVSDKLREEKRSVWNEALEFFGINTNPSDKKKERLVTVEVEANNEQIDIQALTMLATRQLACQQINEKYGLNVEVSLRVEELKSLWDYGLKLHGEVPDGAIGEIIKNQEEAEHGKLYHRV